MKSISNGLDIAFYVPVSQLPGWYIKQATDASSAERKQREWDKKSTLIAKFMGSAWGPSGADKTQVGPVFAP